MRASPTLADVSRIHPDSRTDGCSDVSAEQAPDFKPQPVNFLPNVTEPAIRQWALDVHALWNQLYRVENSSVQQQPERHSLIYVPNPAVVPGARFRSAPHCKEVCRRCNPAQQTLLARLRPRSVHSMMCREIYYWCGINGRGPSFSSNEYLPCYHLLCLLHGPVRASNVIMGGRPSRLSSSRFARGCLRG